MISLIWTFVKSFFTSNKSYLLIGFACVCVLWVTYNLGLNHGKLTANQVHLMRQTDQAKAALSQFISNSKINLQTAHQLSNQILQQTVERKLDDEQSTRRLQQIFNTNASRRDNCLFDDNVLQLIDTARKSAVNATTFGITAQPKRAVRGASGAP